MKPVLPEYDFTKVLVRRQKKGTGFRCHREHFGVLDAWCDLSDIQDGKPLITKGEDDFLVDAFVGNDWWLHQP